MKFQEMKPDPQDFRLSYNKNGFEPMIKVSGSHTCAVCGDATAWLDVIINEFICGQECREYALEKMMECAE